MEADLDTKSHKNELPQKCQTSQNTKITLFIADLDYRPKSLF